MPNRYGKRLIELCQVNTIFICNGRMFSDKGVGAITCLDWKCVKQAPVSLQYEIGSVVDYVIYSGCLLGNIGSFEIANFDRILSDRHKGVIIEFRG
jgi:hypothetical protein